MALLLDNPLQALAEAAFGTPTSPLSSRPSIQAREELAAAWAQAPTRYREGLLASVFELVARRPERLPGLLEDLPFIGWNTGRGVMPLWAEWFLGIPEHIGRVPPRPGIVPARQSEAWVAWWSHAKGRVDQLSTLCAPFDPYERSPRALSEQRGLAFSEAFSTFLSQHEQLSSFREAMIQDVFIPLACVHEDGVMAGRLASALARVWVSDVSQGHPEPTWSQWMFQQSRHIWPNHAHRIADPSSPPHLYGLPEQFLSLLLSRPVLKAGTVDALPAPLRLTVTEGLERSLRSRLDGQTAPSPWLPASRALRAQAKPGSSLRSYLDRELLSMEARVLRPEVIQASARHRLF